ncbi:hypothetical protein [Lentibacillus cibarius]|uniref:Uncharacterized protein n=1 Tax=Lentibacillus cibarius TaxID=2583219 RepID=A0A5S3QJ30_9BACI|nr:hypothetical protein [Lentibacillus cibarius]TMN21924.1 hypothetical protein FFL34_07190 [Lentibacillus cibarius]
MAMPGLQRAVEAKVIKKQLHLSHKKKSPTDSFFSIGLPSCQELLFDKNREVTGTGPSFKFPFYVEEKLRDNVHALAQQLNLPTAYRIYIKQSLHSEGCCITFKNMDNFLN